MLLKDKFEISFLAFENQLETNTASTVHQIRSKAFKNFETQGFPTTHQEAWKYSSLKPLLKEDYQVFSDLTGSLDYADVKPYFLNQTECYNLVFIDGVFSNFLSETTHEKQDICVLSAAMNKKKYIPIVHKYFNKLIPEKENALAQLNTAFAKEGAYIRIPRGVTVDKPIQILNFNTGEKPQWLQPRNLIILEENAEAQIIERHRNLTTANLVTNSVTEIHLENMARLHHYKIQKDTGNTGLLDHTFIHQKRASTATVNTFSFGNKFIRNNLSFDQQGEGCESNLNGISILGGKQHVDNHTLIAHNAPNCTSNETYKGIYDERATGVFNGRVWVDKDAQKINAYQQNDNILISEKANVNTKPQLEIFADDVKCSHGCTIGQLDENALFYMQQRGIAKSVAKSLLMYTFASEAVKDIKIPELQSKIDKMITEKLNLEIGFTL